MFISDVLDGTESPSDRATTQQKASAEATGRNPPSLPLRKTSLLAPNGHAARVAQCLLSGVERTSVWTAPRTENDPKPTLSKSGMLGEGKQQTE
jgi:hypothetical protein